MRSIYRGVMALLVILLIAFSFFAGTATATSDGKVYVCKYVGTPGEDERLQTGQKPSEPTSTELPVSTPTTRLPSSTSISPASPRVTVALPATDTTGDYVADVNSVGWFVLGVAFILTLVVLNAMLHTRENERRKLRN